MPSSKRLRNFCFTINNYTDEDIKNCDDLHEKGLCKYIIYGKEEAKTGTPHLQGYCELSKQMPFNTVKKLLGGTVHIEPRKGTSEQASVYCKKDGDFIEKGIISRPGGRNDIHAFVEDMKKNPRKRMVDIVEETPLIVAKYPKFVETVRSLYRTYETLNWQNGHPPNMWIWGEPGTGKSGPIREEYKDSIYEKLPNKWWCNYDDQETVLIEDIDPENCKYIANHIKRWADRYPFTAEVKNGMRTFRPKRIVVTSNYQIEDCFSNPEDQKAIRRRFKVIHKVSLRVA